MSEITNTPPVDWDKRQIKQGASFLQSSKWGEFQAALGSRPHFLRGEGWTCLLLEKHTPLGKYLFAPYGPTVDSNQNLKNALETLKSYGKKIGVDWLRLEPMSSKDTTHKLSEVIAHAKGRRAVHDNEPALTRILDLSPSTDSLLAQVSQSTRSFIRKNQREQFLNFKTSTDPNDLMEFAAMLDKVAERKNIGFFPASYFVKQAQILMPAKMMFLEQAYHDDKLVGQALMHDYGQTCSYTFAASLPEARNLSVSALLLWQAVINAKSRGNKKMDLYGTAPDDAPPSHPWYGFSSYKRKFGGQVVSYTGTWDIPLSSRYRAYRLAAASRRLLKRH